MENYLRFKVVVNDRIGIASEILDKLHKSNIDLISVEVFTRKICIKIDSLENNKKEIIRKSIEEIPDVLNIEEIDLLYFEENERRLNAIIDSVEDGILSINKDFKIEIFNSYCEEVFHIKKEKVIGTDIRDLIGEDIPIVNLIKNGAMYDNIECIGKSEKGNIHYITTGRAIKDDKDNTIGAVASIKDIRKTMKLVDILSTCQDSSFTNIIGNSPLLTKVIKLSSTVAKSNSTILIRGESGTGKELFAKAIQNLSSRKDKRFLTINCAAIPDGLIESELFGYEKGSFTGAINSGKIGLFKESDGGTLFLDEIGELSMSIQAKLLRVLQEGVIRKIGSNKEEKIDVRIIAATNKNLEDMIKNKEFREDLYYRLNVIPINIPPLREITEDIPLLVTHFIKNLNKRMGKNVSLANRDFVETLMKYNWPGNVRELQNVIERAMNLCEGNILTIDSLLIDINSNKDIPSYGLGENSNISLKNGVAICEKKIITLALEENKSLRKAAKVLGVSHTTIMNKINKYNIKCNE